MSKRRSWILFHILGMVIGASAVWLYAEAAKTPDIPLDQKNAFIIARAALQMAQMALQASPEYKASQEAEAALEATPQWKESQAKQADLQKAIQKMQERCGKTFNLILDANGYPVCVVPAAPAAPSSASKKP